MTSQLRKQKLLTSSLLAGLVAMIILCVNARNAASAVVDVDPDSLPDGTNISTAFTGITLSAVGGGFGAGPNIFSINSSAQPNEPFNASTGTQVFGTDSPTFPHVFQAPDFLALRVDFTNGTDLVSIDFISTDIFDTGFMRAFNSSDEQVGSYTTDSLFFNQFETMTVTRSAPDIAYILASGDSDTSSGGLDNLQFNLIPEPSSLSLVTFALLLVGHSRRRRRAS